MDCVVNFASNLQHRDHPESTYAQIYQFLDPLIHLVPSLGKMLNFIVSVRFWLDPPPPSERTYFLDGPKGLDNIYSNTGPV